MKFIQTSKHLTRRSAAACVAGFRKLRAGIAAAKKALLAEFQGQFAPYEHLLRLALNEAEALAWQTNYPHLVFPTLAMEKAQGLAAWNARQRSIRGATSMSAFAA